MNPLRALSSHGQAVWMDFIRRDMLTNGELERLVREDGLTGVTSNPAIFESAIGGSTEYDDQIRDLLSDGDPTVNEIYETLAFEDIRLAADILGPPRELRRLSGSQEQRIGIQRHGQGAAVHTRVAQIA